MSDVGNKLKMLIGNYTDSTNPADIFFATMVTPTQIQLDSTEGPLPESLVIIPEYLSSFTVPIKGNFHGEDHEGELEIDNSLKAGDRVVGLSKAGITKYLILGRLQ